VLASRQALAGINKKLGEKAFLRSLRLERLFWSFLAEQNISKGFLDIRLQFE
jgi:hypothetical protein